MLPNIRAVVATIVAATGLLIVAFAAVATFRVAQETRVASLQADLAQRGQSAAPEPRPIVVIETPGPTLLVKAPAAEPELPAPADTASASVEPARTEPSGEAEEAVARVAAPATPERPTIAEVSADPEPAIPPGAVALLPAPDLPVDPPAPPAMVADAPQGTAPREPDVQSPPPSPAPSFAAMGGPSPEEIAQAKARHKLAERARARRAAAEARKVAAQARKAAAEKARKLRAARLAHQRKLAARRAAEARARQQQQQQQQQQQNSFGFNPAASFNSVPFGNAYGFGGATNWPQSQRPAVR